MVLGNRLTINLDVCGQGAAIDAHLDLAGLAAAPLARPLVGGPQQHGAVVGGSAVHVAHHHLVSHVVQFAGQVARVGGPQRGVGSALARSVGRDEVLGHGQPLAETGLDRHLDGAAVRAGHQAAHARQLTDLLGVTARARLAHDPQRVEGVVLLEVLEDLVLHVVGGVVPELHDLLVTLLVGHEPEVEALLDLLELQVGLGQNARLGGRNHDVVDADGDARGGGQLEAAVLQSVEQLGGGLDAQTLEAGHDQVLEGILLVSSVEVHQAVHQMLLALVQGLLHDAPEQDAPGTGLVHHPVQANPDVVLVVDQAALDGQNRLVWAGEAVAQTAWAGLRTCNHHRAVQRQLAVVVGGQRVLRGLELAPRTQVVAAKLGQGEDAQDHIAAGLDARLAVGGRQQVVSGQHLDAGLGLRLG